MYVDSTHSTIQNQNRLPFFDCCYIFYYKTYRDLEEYTKMNFVHTDSLSDIQCRNCQNLLSYFPIYLHPNGSTCGRCPVDENAIRNVAYESLAQKQKFPCRYNEYGCLDNVLPKEVPQHERLCSFRKYSCPIINSPHCEWQGFAKDLLGHFEEKHPAFILKEGSFEIDFIHSHYENNLLPFGDNLYIVNRSTDPKLDTFCCTVTYVGCNNSAEDYYFTIVLENGGNRSNVHKISNKLGCTVEISSDRIRSIFNDTTPIMAQIEVFRHEQKTANERNDEVCDSNINYDLLRDLECLVCLEYMAPPIYQCVTGHSICMKCKEKVNECPTCEEEITNTQNFALAQVINHFVYPCKHDRCKYSAKPKDIKKHEATCIFRPVNCPLKEYVDCDCKISVDDMYDHILKNHPKSVWEKETISIEFEHEDGNEASFIFKYGSKLFQLHFLYDGEDLMWAMQLIGPADESVNYAFDIDLLDRSGGQDRAYFKNTCGPLTDKSEAFIEGNPLIFWKYIQVKHLINDRLCFRVRIAEVNFRVFSINN